MAKKSLRIPDYDTFFRVLCGIMAGVSNCLRGYGMEVGGGTSTWGVRRRREWEGVSLPRLCFGHFWGFLGGGCQSFQCFYLALENMYLDSIYWKKPLFLKKKLEFVYTRSDRYQVSRKVKRVKDGKTKAVEEVLLLFHLASSVEPRVVGFGPPLHSSTAYLRGDGRGFFFWKQVVRISPRTALLLS